MSSETRTLYRSYFADKRPAVLSVVLDYLIDFAHALARRTRSVGVIRKELTLLIQGKDPSIQSFGALLFRMLDYNWKTRATAREVYSEMHRLVGIKFSPPAALSANTFVFTLTLQAAYFPSTAAVTEANQKVPSAVTAATAAAAAAARKVGSALDSQPSLTHCAYPPCTASHVRYKCSVYTHRRYCSRSCAHSHWQYYGCNTHSLQQ
jgi:hypothetical protein